MSDEKTIRLITIWGLWVAENTVELFDVIDVTQAPENNRAVSDAIDKAQEELGKPGVIRQIEIEIPTVITETKITDLNDLPDADIYVIAAEGIGWRPVGGVDRVTLTSVKSALDIKFQDAQKRFANEHVSVFPVHVDLNAVRAAFDPIRLTGTAVSAGTGIADQPTLTTTSPRAFTANEILDQLATRVESLIWYWGAETTSNVPVSNVPAVTSARGRLEGLAHSIMVTFDGASLSLPAFRISAHPTPENPNENWYPADTDIDGLGFACFNAEAPANARGPARPWTEDEIRGLFAQQVRLIIDRWTLEAESTRRTDRTYLRDAAEDILRVFDGNGTLPRFSVIPFPHEDDREFHIAEGENWYPDDVDLTSVGSLADRLTTNV